MWIIILFWSKKRRQYYPHFVGEAQRIKCRATNQTKVFRRASEPVWYFNHMIISLCQAFNFYPSSSGVPISTDFIPAPVTNGRDQSSWRGSHLSPHFHVFPLLRMGQGSRVLRGWQEGKEQTTHCRGHRDFQHPTEEVFVVFAWLCLTERPVWTLEIMSEKDLRVKTSQDGFLENCHFILAYIH